MKRRECVERSTYWRCTPALPPISNRLTRFVRRIWAMGVVGVLAASAEPVRLYLANDDHTDYMWTADADTYRRVFVELLDYYMKLADDTAGNPPPFQSRFNTDGALWLWEYERNKSPAEFARVIAQLKSGHLSSPLTAAVSCYGAQPTEAVLRGMYYAGRLERRFGLRFPQAVAMENQSLPLGLASLWAGSGAEFSWRGVCGCASKLKNTSLADREHEIYWCAGPDGQRVLMKWHSFVPGGSKQSGGYAEAFDPVKAIRFLASNPKFLSRYRAPGVTEPYGVRAAFGFGWDALNRKTGVPYTADPKTYPFADHFHVIAQAETTPERQVIVSNQEDFFRDFAQHYGAQLPTESVTYGNEWDLYSASMAETSARVRRAVERLRTAEALATIVALHDSAAPGTNTAARDQAFMDLGLYWEHDWTADGPVSRSARAEWQNVLADRITAYVDTLLRDSAARLSALIPSTAPRPRFYVFNPLGWSRSDAADLAYDGPEDIHVHDLTDAADTPHQFVTLLGRKHLRILARELPSFGYKVFELRPGPGSASREPAATLTARVLENSSVKLTLDRDGALAGLIDKRAPTIELAATIDGLKVNDLAAHETGGRDLVVENSGPVSVTVRATSGAARNHVTRITLYRDSDRIDLHNEITENFGDVRHWAFGFNLSAPDVHTEELGAIIRLKTKSAGGDYAERNARYDYATLNHFADLTDGTGVRGVTLSNWDCSFVRLGRSKPDALDTATAQLHVLAGGQVDGDQLGVRNQNGASHFLQRFALRPHLGYDPVAAMRFALEHQNPPLAAAVHGGPASVLPANTVSLLSVSDPRVLLWSVKPAEEGGAAGIIARLWNISDSPATATITFPSGLAGVHRTTHIETNLESVALTLGRAFPATFTRQQLQTYRLRSR
jgi:alpha-mannosidase